MKYNPTGKYIRLSGETSENVLTVCDVDCILEELYDDARDGKGGNSSVFRAVDPSTSDNLAVVKFCKFPVMPKNRNFETRIKRFRREVRVLNEAQQAGLNDFIVRIVDQKVTEINTGKGGRVALAWYAMEYAQSDLRRYLAENELSLDQKFLLSEQLVDGLVALHGLGYYHRDLKPDNILLIDGRWKVGDLGLLSDRDDDELLDRTTEKIGPTGFLSPEATNRAIGNRKSPRFTFDCCIDEKSDVYQLTQLFWFIFQDEVATGCLNDEDWRDLNKALFYDLLVPGLQYCKDRRPDLRGVKQILLRERKTLGVA